MKINIKAVDGQETIVREYYSNHGTFHEGDSGLDLFCLNDIVVPARARGFMARLGVSAEVTKDSVDQAFCEIHTKSCSFFLLPRSSTGLKTPIRLSNSIGLIDAGYRGELIAIVDNLSDAPFTLKKGERYFQVCLPSLKPFSLAIVDKLSETTRGIGGLGST